MRNKGLGRGTDTYLLGGSRFTILRSDEQTVGAYCLLDVVKPPGARTMPHSHMLEWEAVYGLDGSLRVDAAGATRTLEAGGLATLPPGVPHRFWNATATDAHYLLFCAPAGFDDFVREAGQEVGPDSGVPPFDPADAESREQERILVAAPRHGLTILSEEALLIRTAQAGLVDGEGREALDMYGLEAVVLSELGAGHAAPVLVQATLPRGAVSPLHRHRDPEMVYVVSGELDVFRGRPGVGEWVIVGPGGVADVPPGVPHAFRNAGSGPVEAFVATTGGMLRFLRAVGPAVSNAMGVALHPLELGRRREAAAAQFGHWVATPEQNAEIGILSGEGPKPDLLH